MGLNLEQKAKRVINSEDGNCDEVNQEESEQNEVDGTKDGVGLNRQGVEYREKAVGDL